MFDCLSALRPSFSPKQFMPWWGFFPAFLSLWYGCWAAIDRYVCAKSPHFQIRSWLARRTIPINYRCLFSFHFLCIYCFSSQPLAISYQERPGTILLSFSPPDTGSQFVYKLRENCCFFCCWRRMLEVKFRGTICKLLQFPLSEIDFPVDSSHGEVLARD